MEAAVPAAAAAKPKQPETPEQRYLRQIRNVIVAAFVIALVTGCTWAIVVASVTAHDHALQQQAACNNSGGVYVNGQCI